MVVASWTRNRAILHADLDCFFAAVEALDDPSIKGLPVVVGGTGNRGVVAAASYEARIYGIHSAMSMATARRLCPNAIIINGRYSRYVEVSGVFHEILERFTDQIESIGLDEAFLDVTGAQGLFGHPAEIAAQIRDDVAQELSLSLCIGVGSSKQIAKLASRRAKPSIQNGRITKGAGVYVVEPGSELAFLSPLGVGELWGVGPKTRERLNAVGIRTINDLRERSEKSLVHLLGKAGYRLFELANGRDTDPVSPNSRRKSVGKEQTYPVDLRDIEKVMRELVRLTDSVSSTLNAKSLRAKTFTVKVRFGDFSTITRSVTLSTATSSSQVILNKVRQLVDPEFAEDGIRLLGISASNLTSSKEVQLTLDDMASSKKVDALTKSITEIRSRYGVDSVAPASLLDSGRLNVKRDNEAQWGPQVVGEDEAP